MCLFLFLWWGGGGWGGGGGGGTLSLWDSIKPPVWSRRKPVGLIESFGAPPKTPGRLRRKNVAGVPLLCPACIFKVSTETISGMIPVPRKRARLCEERSFVEFQHNWEFDIQPFSAYNFNERLISDPVRMVHGSIGFEWEIHVYPGGSELVGGEERRNHMGVFLRYKAMP